MEDGRWKIKDLSEGQYTFTASKIGFEHFKSDEAFNFKYDLVENYAVVYRLILRQKPTGIITLSQPEISTTFKDSYNDSARVVQLQAIFTNITIGRPIFANLYFGESDVSMLNYATSGATDTTRTNVSNYSVAFFKNSSWNGYREDELLKAFPSGTKVYVRAYFIGNYGGIFTDPKTGEKRAIGFGPPSNVVSFTMP